MITASWIELLKLRRARTVWIVNAVGCLVPVMTAAAIVSIRLAAPTAEAAEVEALLPVLNADWDMFMQINAQLLLQAGLMLLSLMAAFIFAREYRENTYVSLMMLPGGRWRTVVAKFVALFVWITLLAGTQLLIALGLGLLIGVGPLSVEAALFGFRYIVVIAWLFFLAMPVMSLFACLGRGYLAPMSLATGALIATMPLSASELIYWLPWAIPTAYAVEGRLPLVAVIVLATTFLLGVAGTVIHYYAADTKL